MEKGYWSLLLIIFNKVPGRMGLLVTLYLISSNVYSSLQAPIQRGFSYIEIFLIGTQGVIFFAILEYGFVLAWMKYSNDETPNKKITSTNSQQKKGSWFIGSKMSLDVKIKVIDKISLIISLIFFLFFNMIYWANAYLFEHD